VRQVDYQHEPIHTPNVTVSTILRVVRSLKKGIVFTASGDLL